ncbi:MAG: L,D-transpeptidase [Solirubrobacteraceae bacterium]
MRRHRALPAAALAAMIVAGGPAAGATIAAGSATTATSGSATTAKTTTSPASTPPATATSPVKGSISLYLPDAFAVHRKAVTVPGRVFHVVGVVRPYVPGQWVSVKSFVGRRLIKSDRLRIKPSGNHRNGLFREALASARAGLVRIEVTHQRTVQMLGFSARRAIAALNENAGFGSTGTFVDLMAQRLQTLHVYLPQSGVYDQHMVLAIDAYHRLLGWGVSQSLDGATIRALLDGRGAFKVRYPHDGTHVEGNLGQQLLALIYGSKVYRIYPISSGKPSTPTVLGHFHVYSRVPGYLPDGMYYSDFFYGGYAIHGYNPAPDYVASHGCMRLPITDAISVFDWLNYGDVVDVYN